jgi:ribosomal protein S27E
MAIPVECKSCGHKARVPDNAAGKKIRCPKCNNVIQVPDKKK